MLTLNTEASAGNTATNRGVIGWDVGGANTKVARVGGGEVLAVRERPYELQRAPDELVPLLRDLALEVGADARAAHALTMTAELSQMFRTKREGVAFVLHHVHGPAPLPVIGHLALVHLAQHDRQAARASIDRALHANPNHQQARQLRDNLQRQP